MRNLFFIFFFLFSFLQVFGQELVRINDESYAVEEFRKNYENNIKANGKEAALNRFIKTKLLLQDAYNQKIDTTKFVRGMLNNELNILQSTFLGISKKKDSLMDLAAERKKIERKVLVFFIESESKYKAIDSKKAKKELSKFSKKLFANNSVEFLKKKYPSVKSINDFNPIYYRYGMLSYPLENLIYNTEVGKTSEPICIDNSCYVVKVIEERESYGKIKLQHIFIPLSDTASTNIEKAYANLKAGVSFDEIVKKYSKDERTKDKNGELPLFEGNLSEDILSEVVHLKNNEYSKPILQKDGWYIFKKMFQVKPCQKLAFCKAEIEKEVMKSDKKIIIDNFIIEKAKTKVPHTIDSAFLNMIVVSLTEELFSNDSIESKDENDKKIISVAERAYFEKELSETIRSLKTELKNKKELLFMVNKTVDEVKNKMLLDEYLQNLEKYEPEFSALKNTTTQNIMMLSFVNNNIYPKAAENIKNIEKYFNTVKSSPSYTWPKRIDVDIYTCNTQEIADMVNKLIGEKKSPETILKTINKSELEVYLETGNLFSDNDKLKELNDKEIGIHTVKSTNKTKVFYVKRIIEPITMTFEEAKNSVFEEYKEVFLEEYYNELKKNSIITINSSALEQI